MTLKRRPRGSGEMVIKEGSSVTFRYRFLFHEGDAKSADIEKAVQRFRELIGPHGELTPAIA